MRLNSYPTDYRLAFAFSLILYPLPDRFALRSAFLSVNELSLRQTRGLLRSADALIMDDLGCDSSPRTRRLRGETASILQPGHLPFWSKPISIFGLLYVTAFIIASRSC